MAQPTKAFVLTDLIVEFLKERSIQEDRPTSYIVRRIIEGEMKLYPEWRERLREKQD